MSKNTSKKNNKVVVAAIIAVAVLLVGIVVFAILDSIDWSYNNIDVTLDSTSLLVKGQDGFDFAIPIEVIDEVDVIHSSFLDLDTPIDVVNKDKYLHGTYFNEEFGEFIACLNTKVTEVVVVYAVDHVYVFNATNNERTDEIFRELDDYVFFKDAVELD